MLYLQFYCKLIRKTVFISFRIFSIYHYKYLVDYWVPHQIIIKLHRLTVGDVLFLVVTSFLYCYILLSVIFLHIKKLPCYLWNIMYLWCKWIIKTSLLRKNFIWKGKWWVLNIIKYEFHETEINFNIKFRERVFSNFVSH